MLHEKANLFCSISVMSKSSKECIGEKAGNKKRKQGWLAELFCVNMEIERLKRR